MADVSAGVSQQASEVNLMNSKLGLDEQFDNRREVLARQRAYEDLNLRRAQNAATFDHLVNMTTAGSTATAQQTGQDTIATSAAAEETANAQVSANVADLATAMVPIISAAVANAVVTAIQALYPVNTAAAGTAAGTANPKGATA